MLVLKNKHLSIKKLVLKNKHFSARKLVLKNKHFIVRKLMLKNKHLVNKSTHRHGPINTSRALQDGHGETLKESLHEYRTVATMTPGSRLTTEAE